MQGLEDHRFRFTSDELFNGLPAQLVDKWSALGIKAAVGYNSLGQNLKNFGIIYRNYRSLTFLCTKLQTKID